MIARRCSLSSSSSLARLRIKSLSRCIDSCRHASNDALSSPRAEPSSARLSTERSSRASAASSTDDVDDDDEESCVARGRVVVPAPSRIRRLRARRKHRRQMPSRNMRNVRISAPGRTHNNGQAYSERCAGRAFGSPSVVVFTIHGTSLSPMSSTRLVIFTRSRAHAIGGVESWW